MKKIVILMMFVLSIFTLGLTSKANELPTTLVIHYYRYDDNYTGFNMWVWENQPVSRGGIKHDFDVNQKDEKGVYYELDLASDYPGATRIGIIIKQGEWDGYREIGGDRFIELSEVEVIGGVGHAYFVEQDINIGLSEADLENNIPDYREKILTVAFDKDQRIQANLTHIPTGYEVYENDTLKLSSTTTPTSKNLLITVPGVDISKTYTLKVMFESENVAEKIVSLQNLYDTAAFEDLYTYDGTLGVSFEDEFTIFRLWAPLSSAVSLNLYHQGHPMYNDQGVANEEKTPYQVESMYKIENGAWEVKLTGDLDFKYYTFSVTNNNVTHEVTDPYAYSTGANGQRGMIVNFDETNPSGWTYNSRPNTIQNLTDYIVWELHVRDLTAHSSWQGTPSYRGKFMGLTEGGAKYTHTNGVTVTTGLDHIDELGVNAVQLLPIFDFGYVDEIQVALNPNYQNVFNWGYMPYHFNTLEGSYSTNPFNGRTRIEEFKQTVMAFHERDIRVIMDVVYNHTGESEGSNFHKIVPGYYHRLTSTGGFSNGSGTGNETASERSMMRKFMVDSVKFWATEYNLSGFRFDLMALHDYETMNEIQAMLEEIDPTIIVYGEPWNGGSTPLPQSIDAGKTNIKNMNLVGAFNDITRDAVKGSVFQASEKGWIQGNSSDYNVQGIKYGILGGISHSSLTMIDEWHLNPNQTINYVTAHDNNTLYDKLRLTGISVSNSPRYQIQANAIVLTSQGVPFLHAGVEMMRSKPLQSGGYDHNSYESPDSVNQLRWDRKAQYVNVFEYYKALIEIRQTFNHFRIDNANDIRNRVTFLDTNAGNEAIAYKISGLAGEPEIIVMHAGNPSSGLARVNLTAGKTYKLLTSDVANMNGIEIISDAAFAPSNTSIILVEVMDPSITITAPVVTVAKGASFDPASNVTIHNASVEVYYSNYFDTNTPGLYTITVAVKETYGQVNYYTYQLDVIGRRFNVEVKAGGES
ncbi:MAG: type I pullulanase [Tenericutes bacterium HGW-Tenericutes-6]|nr:MAG: type I pullulanase [Tenericutes bacterium HGW-Tenericutes-6]